MAEKNEAYHLAAIKFEGEDRAKQVVKMIKDEQKAGDYKVKAWAVVEVNEKGKAKVSQSGHGGMGAAIGAGSGALLGLIGGPAGLLAWALGGALIGGLAGKYGTRPFDNQDLEAIGNAMEPNTSGIIVVVEDTAVQDLADELGAKGGSLLTITLGDELSGEVAQLAAVDLGEIGEAGDN